LKKKKFAEFLLEVVGFLTIFASPLLLGTAIGLAFSIKLNNKTGLIIGILIAFFGLIVGIFWGVAIWKKTGTFNYISTIVETSINKQKRMSNRFILRRKRKE